MVLKPLLDDLLLDVDETVERLVENAEMLAQIEAHPEEFQHEISALQQLQESLLSHLMHLEEHVAQENITPRKAARVRHQVKRVEGVDASHREKFEVKHNTLKLRKARKCTKVLVKRRPSPKS